MSDIARAQIAALTRFQPKLMAVVHPDHEVHARPLTGLEAMEVAEISARIATNHVEAIELIAYIAACCMTDASGLPLFQGKSDIEKVKALPFSLLRAVAETVMAECGLEDELDTNESG